MKNLISMMFILITMFMGNTVLWLAHMENNQGKVYADRNWTNSLAAEMYEWKFGEEPYFFTKF